ncbi:hypothetical protein ANME2D_01453 [Candidatus Methanoperedens nitroreducens]|uniref:Uncharacterized protein n=1 Tax=Candidatus Methanoperedens nitratireducens TaxID=1392998 RepID=A0A062V3Z1_9EURY|nr:hypothetical protein [Candidatus Methanoperedens nitroreducens]KCZ72052.1 hypothetical protein ANME2D_01453 [Candidatus Methanoperedens nitroreducens]MDJ1421973.1 hypothetical protein [Candidatus Methanoperedens sp.]
MKKIFVLLLLVSTVIGMAVPAMANPTNWKEIKIDIDGYNFATSNTEQKLVNEGDLTNSVVGLGAGGDAAALSTAWNDNDAKAVSDATTSGHAKSGDATNKCPATAKADDAVAETNDNDSVAVAVNIPIGVAVCDADSGDANNFGEAFSESFNDNDARANSAANAFGGSGEGFFVSGDLTQVNAVVQLAFANTDIDQKLVQTVKIKEFQKIDIDDTSFVEGNKLEDGIIVSAGDDAVDDKNKLST